ncbi:MAG: DUF885 domain-containing protein [Chitinophagales bacterium]|jgi:uncharacterized protein (DUF885 family)|nr:DUF885 domain-containing protein [Chitinophagales bacterium]
MKKLFFYLTIYGLILISCQNQNLDKEFLEYLDARFDTSLRQNPEFAANLGYKYNYGKLNDYSFEKQKADIEFLENTYKKALEMFDTGKLNQSNKITLAMIRSDIDKSREGLKWYYHYYPIHQMGGCHNDLPTFMMNIHKIDSFSDAKDYLSRLSEFPRVFRQVAENLAQSSAKGIVAPKFTFDYVLKDMDNFIRTLTDTSKSILYQDFQTKITQLNLDSSKTKDLLAQCAILLKDSVTPAYINLEKEVKITAQKAKQNMGVHHLPEGEAYYAYCLRNITTTQMTPDEIFELGLREVARIQDEMKAIMKQVKFKNDNLQDFFEFLRTDSQFKYPNDSIGRANLLDESTRYIAKTKEKLKEIFGILPKADVVVMPVEEFRAASAGGAFYENPSLDGTRPGRYYVNLHQMDDEPRYQMEALAAHEGLPGHHMQIAIAQELKDMPMYRKFSFHTAYVEGWALYAEKLNKELGFYTDPYSDFGRLSMEIFRAARLVVDVGIHHKKWTKDEAIQYFLKNTANSKGDVYKEIERYFLWPGQATAYKIGMIHIQKLREKAEKACGKKFDLGSFHDMILANGSVPLDVLTKNTDTWIETHQ